MQQIKKLLRKQRNNNNTWKKVLQGAAKKPYKQIEAAHDKTTKWHVRPAKTQISLGIRPCWSESSLCAQWVVKDPIFLHADNEDWSDLADAQADLSLRWAKMPLCRFCRDLAY